MRLRRIGLAVVTAGMIAFVTLHAQIPGRNVNMVSGTGWPIGDPFLQRQNEPSVAASSRNPLHLLGGSNDYRSVDVPGLLGIDETGDAWLGLYKSFDGGQRWTSSLLPGYPYDPSPDALTSPLRGYQAGADAVVRTGAGGMFYFSGMVFDRVENGKSAIFVARFIDNNNKETGDPIKYLGASLRGDGHGRRRRFARQALDGGRHSARRRRRPAPSSHPATTAGPSRSGFRPATSTSRLPRSAASA